MNAVSTVVGAAKFLAPSSPTASPPRMPRGYSVLAPDGRTHLVFGVHTPEEAIETVRRAQQFNANAPSLGWILGGAVTLLVCLL